MKAIQIQAFRDVGGLRVVELPRPAATPDTAIVRVEAASINPSDVKNIQGAMAQTTLPRIPGRDFAGVVETGPADWIGMEVWGTGGDVGFTRDGTHAQYLSVPVASLRRKPSRLSFDQAASIGVTYMAAWCGTVEAAALQPGETLAVIGAGGGLIGPPGTPRDYPGSLSGTPVFLGSGDPDPHVPFERDRETAAVLTRMGGVVELRRYPGMPHTINLYYGDERGCPGTIMTFFAWPGAPRGRISPPQVTATAFAVPKNAFEFWSQWLAKHHVETEPGASRFREPVLGFADPDGLKVEIVASAEPGGSVPASGPVPAGSAIRGFHGVTLSEEGYENTARLLTEVMGFRAAGNEENRFRYRAATGELASVVDLLCVPDARRGDMGAGVLHRRLFPRSGHRDPGAPRAARLLDRVSARSNLLRAADGQQRLPG